MGLSRLVDASDPLILDASAALNLLGSGRAVDVLRVLRREIVMTTQAAKEVDRDPLTGASGSVALGALVDAGLLGMVCLSDVSYEVFLDLVSAPSPEGLDDGEAATVALAREKSWVPILDERKGTRIATTLCARSPICTLDLFSSAQVRDVLGATGVEDAVHSALLRARMRVPELFRPWVLDLLGPNKLRACTSIRRSWLG